MVGLILYIVKCHHFSDVDFLGPFDISLQKRSQQEMLKSIVDNINHVIHTIW